MDEDNEKAAVIAVGVVRKIGQEQSTTFPEYLVVMAKRNSSADCEFRVCNLDINQNLLPAWMDGTSGNFVASSVTPELGYYLAPFSDMSASCMRAFMDAMVGARGALPTVY